MAKEEGGQIMVAKIILEQMGGGEFVAMTGSKNFIDLGNGLRMNLTRNKTSANRLEITLDRETDTYTMKFSRQTFSKKTFEVSKKDIALHEGVYCDMLEEMFASTTGLYTRL